MAAHEDQPQPVVLDEVTGVGHRPSSGSGGVDDEQGLLAGRHRLGPQPVDDAAPRRGEQPGGRALGDAVRRPVPGRRLDRVAERVLDEVEAAELPEEERDEPPPLVADRRGQRLLGRHADSYPSTPTTGRISTVYEAGSSRAAAMAWSRSGSRTS